MTSRTGFQAPERVWALTAREKEVMRLLGEGLSNRNIAAHLCISRKAVENYVHIIFQKHQLPQGDRMMTRRVMLARMQWEADGHDVSSMDAKLGALIDELCALRQRLHWTAAPSIEDRPSPYRSGV